MGRGVEVTKGLLFLFFAVLVCYAAVQLPLGRFGKPGPGFFPLLLGVILGVLSLFFLTAQLFGRRPATDPAVPPRKERQVLLTLGALLLYSIILPFLGYLVSTVVLVFYLLHLAYPDKRLICGIFSILIAGASYMGFQMVLNIQLPRGLLGI